MSEALNVLIEGFDPSKVKKEEAHYDEAWKEIIGAYQNNFVIQGELVAIEDIRQPRKSSGEGEDSDSDKKGQWENVTCAVVQIESVRGYIPIDEFGVNNKRQLRAFTGRNVVFKVLSFDRENDIFVGSRTRAMDHMANITLNRIEEGDSILAVVSSVSPSLVRADIGGIEVKIPIEDVRYGWIDDLTEEVKVGDHLHVKVLEIDREDKKVEVSRKALLDNPFPDCLKRYKKGNEYTGTVSGVRDYGVFVNLEPGVDSLAHHLKHENVQKGDRVLVRVINFNAEREHVTTRITRVI